jgi:hypothetical protein
MKVLPFVLCALSLFGGVGPREAVTIPSASTSGESILLVNHTSPAYPQASEIRGQQVLMLLRHFSRSARLIDGTSYVPGTSERFDYVVVLGNDAVEAIDDDVLADLRGRERPTLWVGYGLRHLSSDPDREIGFAAPFVEPLDEPVELRYRGGRHMTRLDDRHQVRIASPDAEVLASIRSAGLSIPLAIRRDDFWFYGALPGLDTDYPTADVDATTLVFSDLLHDFLGRRSHDPPQALVRLEDVSVHIDPSRITDAVDALARRGVPFVIAVIPAQRLDDGSILSLADNPEFVQALRYAERLGGTIALHGYHHTFGQGEDFEFWDPIADAAPRGEAWETYALKVEHGIQLLRDAGLDPLLWETPHYAASPLGYRVFASYFSHAIENRDPATWLPFASGPDPSGQILIPENLGYINESEGLTVDAQLARARLLRIVRDPMAVGFYHPASVPVSRLEALVDGLGEMGYRFADLRTWPMSVRYEYEPPASATAARVARVEPGLALLEVRRSLLRPLPFLGWIGEIAFALAVAVALGAFFLWRLRAQWRLVAHTAVSRVETPVRKPWTARAPILLVAMVAVPIVGRLAFPEAQVPVPLQPETARTMPRQPGLATHSEGWEISTYFTAVESFYSGRRIPLRGCLHIDCRNGDSLLGSFPSDFIAAVREEGSGRLADPREDRAYLNWSIDNGYWLDHAPRDARGSILQPYVSAAADPEIDYVTAVEIDRCGSDAVTGRSLVASACEEITSAQWVVRDRFTVGEVGKHIDLYVGEQDQPDFSVQSPKSVHTFGARVRLREYPAFP